MKPHPIAVDNYFVNREDTPRDENGNYNYECLEAIDVELFNRDMNALLKGCLLYTSFTQQRVEGQRACGGGV